MEPPLCSPPPVSPGGLNNPPQPNKLYWIDSSCDEAAGGDFESLHVLEAQHWARRAYERLTSDTDTDFARVFNVIFKTPKTDPQRFPKSDNWQEAHGEDDEDQWQTSSQHVLDILYDFAHSWARTDNREEADVRIYAGARGISRWVPQGDGSYLDPVNCLIASPNLDEAQGFAAYFPFPTPVGDQHPLRCTIDICPAAWAVPDAPQVSVTSLLALDPALLLPENNENLGAAAPNITATNLSRCLVTRLLFHEWMHVHGYLLDDSHDEEEDGSAGWWHCMRRWKGEAVVCAESYAMLGLWAALADMTPRGGFTVDREWDRIPGGWDHVFAEQLEEWEEWEGHGKWDADWNGGNNSALKGELKFYEDLTE